MSRNEFQWPIRVYYEDTDAAGIVYYANYLRFLERARTEWLRSLGWSQHKMMQEKLAFVVAEVQAKYMRPAHLDDELIVHCWMENLKRASLEFCQEVRRGDEILLKGKIRVGCVNTEKLKPTPIPAELIEQLENKN